MVLRDRKLILLLSCSLAFNDLVPLFFECDRTTWRETTGKQTKILQNKWGFQPSANRITYFFTSF